MENEKEIPATGSVNKEQLAGVGEELKEYLTSNDLDNDEFYYVTAAFVAVQTLVEFWGKKDDKIEAEEETPV